MTRAVPYTSLWFGVTLWVLLAGGLICGTAWELRLNYLFAYHAQAAPAEVDRKFMRISYGRHGRRILTPCIDYHYEAGGVTVNCEKTVNGETSMLVSEGGTMPVLYLPDEVTCNRIELPDEIVQIKSLTVFGIMFSLIAAVGGALLIRYYVNQNKLNRWLLSSGSSCEGRVSEVGCDLTGRYHNIARYYLTFDFRDNQGRERSGRTWYLRTGAEASWREGDSIRVYFDPQNSERFTVAL